MATCPVALSAAALNTWLAPLFGHSMAWPPEAAASLTTASGEKLPWPARLSNSTTSEPPPLVLLLLDDELLELEELEELLLDDELDVLELEELELLELAPPSPVQTGAAKLPSWLPCKPKPVL
jgi:hypothetical protein